MDLATMPLYARAGAVIPAGPVRQYSDEPVPGDTTLTVYPGADGVSQLYEDDGRSFEYRSGAWTRIAMEWRDRARRLTLRLARGSRAPDPAERRFEVRLSGSTEIKSVTFHGRTVEVRLSL